MTESQVDLNRAKPGKMDSISLWSAITGISVLLVLLRDLLLNKSEISSWLAMRICV
ncbi:MAG: hypothetical protein JST01_08245 [Cyanobacteria bacterium SZAS TMP-1]|nr:hypothetical protein [Cyanobacteria bacterium SZAS TMP-1]